MKSILMILTLIVVVSIDSAQAQMKGDTYHLPAVDITAEKNKAISAKDVPLKYAVKTEIKDIFHKNGKNQAGHWTQLKDGSWEFQLRLFAKNATSLNVNMSDFFLPHSAELWVSTDDESIMRGPFNDTYNKNHGFFWVGDVPADHMNIRITVNDIDKKYLSYDIDNITRGFYKYWEEPSYINKSGSCNVDVACPESDGWEAEISSVGRYTFSTSAGSFVCTGQLINNTSQDGTPLFSTADHCGYSGNNGQEPLSARQNVAASISLTWNYQSSTCRTPGSAQSGVQISTSGFNDRQSGATYLASNPASDFSLVRLNSTPNANYELEYTGWDRRDIAPNSAVGIHHPAGHAKRISFENDPLSVTTYLSTIRGAGTHLRVTDWDLGTTEGGSSGSGLWNSDKLFVGQLHGGYAACGNDRDDWYGRLYVSWDNGNDAQSRMKDWLDPTNTGQETLQGTGGCEAPSVAIINNSSNKLGEMLTFSSQVSGGAGGYIYEWDINADDGIDGKNSSIQARYSHEFVGNISLKVKDSAGCQATTSQAVIVTGADIQLQQVQNIRENLDQVCGNNDSVIDPGERWSTLLTVQNVGTQTANDTYLALGKNRSSVASGQSDSYGNTTSSCDRLFIDISSTGTLLSWEAAANVTNAAAEDEGSALVQLSQAFDHYGTSVSQVRASTNGFISTSPSATGGDWDNDCPLPQAPDKDNTGARISPMHDDLKDAMFYHQTFSSCPRPADVGGDLACEVFLWKGADLFETPSTESIDIQAILYPATSQWVYQYAGSGFDGSSSTTGMQNTASSDGLTYACNTANSINTTEAVCTFNKNHQPAASDTGFVTLENPVISLGDMSVNASMSESMYFYVSPDATCGASFGINHEASVFEQGFNAGEDNIFTGTIGNNGQCNVVTSCPIPVESNFIQPKNGLWWNPNRSGNGMDLHVYNGGSLLYVMYTGNTDRSPIWYIANNADSSSNQYYNDILEVNFLGGYPANNQQIDTIGWSNTTFLDANNAIQVRNIKGELSAEKIKRDQFAADETPNNHSGHYFTPAEDGWGHSIITLGDTRVVITFIFDQEGRPFWTIAAGANDSTAKDVLTADTFCPSCPSLIQDVYNIGTIRMDLNGQINGDLLQYQISHPPRDADWNKSNLPLINLVPPSN